MADMNRESIGAIEFGDMHPNAEILGNDLSPIQPAWYARYEQEHQMAHGVEC